MTLSVRNSILLAGTVLAILLCILCAAAVFYASVNGVTIKNLRTDTVQYWWMVYTEGRTAAWVLPVIFCISLFSASAGFFLRRFFRKTVSFEMFFFTMFILSISFDAFRSMQLLIRVWDASPYFGVLVTRVSYLGRFFGTFCLFASSIYAMNIQYQKLGTVLGLMFFLSFSIAVSIPFDITVLLQNLLYRANFEKGLFIVSGGLSLFTFLNFVRAGFLKGMREYSVVLAAVLLVLTGRGLLFFLGSSILAGLGGVFLLVGTVIIGKKFHSMYLWA